VAGAAAGGAQGCDGGGGTVNAFFVYSVRADYLLSTFRAMKNFFWKPRSINR